VRSGRAADAANWGAGDLNRLAQTIWRAGRQLWTVAGGTCSDRLSPFSLARLSGWRRPEIPLVARRLAIDE
jgi:hypothetical protein